MHSTTLFLGNLLRKRTDQPVMTRARISSQVAAISLVSMGMAYFVYKLLIVAMGYKRKFLNEQHISD